MLFSVVFLLLYLLWDSRRVCRAEVNKAELLWDIIKPQLCMSLVVLGNTCAYQRLHLNLSMIWSCQRYQFTILDGDENKVRRFALLVVLYADSSHQSLPVALRMTGHEEAFTGMDQASIKCSSHWYGISLSLMTFGCCPSHTAGGNLVFLKNWTLHKGLLSNIWHVNEEKKSFHSLSSIFVYFYFKGSAFCC